LPVVEVIAAVVQAGPGRDGKYRVRLTDAQITAYHKAARKQRAVLWLNLQPGRSEFITEAKAIEKPDALALLLHCEFHEIHRTFTARLSTASPRETKRKLMEDAQNCAETAQKAS
jgi:hypothetical protein